MKLDLILRVVTKLLIPFILLFALYVQFHGDFGPGGGFQAGVILAAVVIFYALIFGVADARKRDRAAARWSKRMMPLGVLIYAGVGVAGLLLGGNYLDYFVLDQDPPHGTSIGNLLGRGRRRWSRSSGIMPRSSTCSPTRRPLMDGSLTTLGVTSTTSSPSS